MSNITKKAIAVSLKKLLLKKQLSKITVADITEDCGINRQTFYYHFQDIYDLVEWICINDTEEVLKENRTYETWQEGLLSVFNLAKQDKAFIDNIYHSVKYESLVQYLYRLVYPLLYNVINEQYGGKGVIEEDKVFVADYYKYAFVGFLLDWVRDDMRTDPREIIEKISYLTHGSTDKYLQLRGYKI